MVNRIARRGGFVLGTLVIAAVVVACVPPDGGPTSTTSTSVPGGSPTASLSVTRVPGGASVTGTATDPDAAPPIEIDIDVDGARTTVVTDSDGIVDTIVPIVAAESSEVCPTVRNVGVGDDLRSSCVTVPGTRPVLGVTRYQPGSLIEGHALDYEWPVPPWVSIEYYDDDGTLLDSDVVRADQPDDLAPPAGGARTIVGASPAVYGSDHGFRFEGPFVGSTFCLGIDRSLTGDPPERIGCYPFDGLVPTSFSPLYTLISRDPVQRLNPCAPVYYVMNLDGMTAAVEEQIHESFARAEAATGIDFRYEGPTDEKPWPGSLSDVALARPLADPDRYGNRWSPILVALASGDDLPDVFGAGSAAIGIAGARVIEPGRPAVTGVLYLQREFMLATPTGYDAAASGSLVLHEIGHVLGLGHANDPRQLMWPVFGLRAGGFADGDLAGLQFLGTRAGCATTD